MAREERDAGLAGDVDLGQHDRQLRRVAVCGGSGCRASSTARPIDSEGDFTGNLLDLFSPYSVFAGIAVVALFAFHGATFLTLRTMGDLRARSETVARRLAIPGAVLAAAYLVWTVVIAMDRNDKDLFPPALPAALGVVALALAVVFVLTRSYGRAFAATALAAISLVATLFVSLYPRVMVSSTDFENSLTVERRSFVALRAPGDERRGVDLRPTRAPVPGLDVLRVPRARR